MTDLRSSVITIISGVTSVITWCGHSSVTDGVRGQVLDVNLPALGGASVPAQPVLGHVQLDRQELPHRHVIKLAIQLLGMSSK